MSDTVDVVDSDSNRLECTVSESVGELNDDREPKSGEFDIMESCDHLEDPAVADNADSFEIIECRDVETDRGDL